jgi:asparagine synthase (glutamine-hydrolysing)
MCGITGSVNWGDINVLAHMTALQAHRGPDDSGLWQTFFSNDGWIGLGTRRLSILDLSERGHLPMSTPDGNLTIVYNGEIYNHLKLREELIPKGYKFRSTSDAETILSLYQHLGPECLKHLNGMFAFAIWDKKREKLFLARDRFGIKPLYYVKRQNKFAFASEAKSLLELPGFERRINHKALHQFLTFLWVPEPLTMFDGISKLPAGHYATWSEGQLRIVQYWDWIFPTANHTYAKSEKDLIEELRERLLATVKAQMLSDVPVGAFLSAGLDSSSIVAAMRQATNAPIRTYTISFPNRYRRGELTLDDTEVARRTARHFGCDHTQIDFEPEAVNLLPHLVWHMDEPVADPAIIAAYLVNREAGKSLKVLQSGVGADELFAGYRKHVAHKLAQKYQRIPALLRREVVEPLIERFPPLQGTPFTGYLRLAKKMVRSGSLAPIERFLTDCTYINDLGKNRLYTDLMRRTVEGVHPWGIHLEYLEHVKDADWINQMLYLDAKAFMVSLNLNYNDKMGMASGIEVRVPFLDHELTEWVAAQVPPQMKLHGHTKKYILREAMRPLLPPEVLRQQKAGFGAPISGWLREDLREMVGDLLNESSVKQRGLFRCSEVNRLISEQLNGRHEHSLQIWQLLTLELWMQTFIDKPAVELTEIEAMGISATNS